MKMRCRFGAVLFVTTLMAFPVFAQDAPRKWAFLVGVGKYDKAGLRDLDFAEKDVTTLAAELQRGGFTVKTMLGSSAGADRATRENLRTALETKFVDNLARLNKDDIVLIAFSGHGMQFQVSKDGMLTEDSFFCPVDALKTDSKTLLSISNLMDRVAEKSGAENNLLLIDACRDNPGKGAGKGIDGSRVTQLPVNVAVLFSSSAGTQSYESRDLQHGLFTYYLLDGLRGRARDVDGEVTWGTLVNYVKKQVINNAEQLVGNRQRPNDITNLNTVPILMPRGLPDSTPTPRPTSPPSTVASKSITNSINMTLNLIPAGEFQMGSPATEADRSDDEQQHRVRITQPFYIATTEVTQGQWTAVMGTMPWQGQQYVREGSDYAATYISWEDAVEFCRRLSVKDSRTYRLPTEAEWEYACRAGSTTAYSFGSSATSLADYAWFDANAYDVDEKYSHRVSQKRANAFGLFDMHGNVWEWCADRYDETYNATSAATSPDPSRVHRGGSWNYPPELCRSAGRNGDLPAIRNNFLGFRVCSSVK